MATYAAQATAYGSGYSSSDPVSNLFEPDVVLPSQFLDSDSCGLIGGERRLMAAILSDGIEAYITQCTQEVGTIKAGKADAREWVETRDFGYVFSFDIVCECLGINPEYLRFGLDRYLKASRQKKVASQNAAENAVENKAGVWKRIRRPRKR